jgi:hypothetical protein
VIPAFRHWAAKRPFHNGLALVGLGALAFSGGRQIPGHENFSHQFDGWYYVYMLGWTFPLATKSWQKALLVAIGSVVICAQFGFESSRAYWFMGALVVLALVKEVRLPSAIGGIVAQLAAASYMAYLAHPLVLHITKFVLPKKIAFFQDNVPAAIILTYVGTLAAGLVGTWIWQQVSQLTLERFNRRETATA